MGRVSLCGKIFLGFELGLSVGFLGFVFGLVCALGIVFVGLACVCMLFSVCMNVVSRVDWYVPQGWLQSEFLCA